MDCLKLAKKVSIPKGAIEGVSPVFTLTKEPKFQYQKVRLKVAGTYDVTQLTIKFQYQKVRLKVSSRQNITLKQFLFQYQKVRLKGICSNRVLYQSAKVSIPKGAIEGGDFSQSETLKSKFQYQKVRLKGRDWWCFSC